MDRKQNLPDDGLGFRKAPERIHDNRRPRTGVKLADLLRLYICNAEEAVIVLLDVEGMRMIPSDESILIRHRGSRGEWERGYGYAAAPVDGNRVSPSCEDVRRNGEELTWRRSSRLSIISAWSA